MRKFVLLAGLVLVGLVTAYWLNNRSLTAREAVLVSEPEQMSAQANDIEAEQEISKSSAPDSTPVVELTAAETTESANSGEQVILVLGDSLSAAHNMAVNEGWVAILDEDFDGGGCPVQMVNASISGETSAGGLTRLPALIESHEPDVVIIELGGNDGLRGLPIASLKANLQAMIVGSRESGAEVALLGIQIPTNYGRRYGEALGQVYLDLAKDFDTPLIPFFLEGIALNPNLMQRDGIHPGAVAQPLLADRVQALLADSQLLECP